MDQTDDEGMSLDEAVDVLRELASGFGTDEDSIQRAAGTVVDAIERLRGQLDQAFREGHRFATGGRRTP